MIPVSVNIYAFFVTLHFIIFFGHNPILQLGEYKMHLRCCICQQFPWHCVILVCKGRYGLINCRQKHIIVSLLIVFTWKVWNVLFEVSGWRLICRTVTSTRAILFHIPHLFVLRCYIMPCQQVMKEKQLIYNL